MRKLLITSSILSLLVIIASTVLFIMGIVSELQNKQIMLAGSIFWFVTTPFWLKKIE